MIRATATGEGGKALHILGISEGNVERLKRGQPILVDLEEMGGEGEVLIFYGPTEKAMVEQLRSYGVVSDETRLRVDPRLNPED